MIDGLQRAESSTAWALTNESAGRVALEAFQFAWRAGMNIMAMA
jgi:hypothetical protein